MAFSDEITGQSVDINFELYNGPLDYSDIVFWNRFEAYKMNSILDHTTGASDVTGLNSEDYLISSDRVKIGSKCLKIPANMIVLPSNIDIWWGCENDGSKLILRPLDDYISSSSTTWINTTSTAAMDTTTYKIGTSSLQTTTVAYTNVGVEYVLSPADINLTSGRFGAWVNIPADYETKWSGLWFSFWDTGLTSHTSFSIRRINTYNYLMQLSSSYSAYVNAMKYNMSVVPGWHWFEWAWDCSYSPATACYFYIDGVLAPLNYPGAGWETVVFNGKKASFNWNPDKFWIYSVGEDGHAGIKYNVDNIIKTNDYNNVLYGFNSYEGVGG